MPVSGRNVDKTACSYVYYTWSLAYSVACIYVKSDLDTTLLCSAVPQVIITNPPQSTLVTEGNNATFDCTVEDNGSPATVGWLFTPSGSSSGIALATGTNVTGIEMVTVSGGLRTMLTFSGVRREANGGTVECIAATDRSKPMNLTVQCEYDHITLFRHTTTFPSAVMLAKVERVCFSFA